MNVHPRAAIIAVTMAVVVTSNLCCRPDPHSGSQSPCPPPPISFGQIGMEGPYGGAVHIEAPEVMEYVRRYGLPGWLAGLTDQRPLSKAYTEPSAPPVSTQAGVQEDELLVRDLFLYYYIQQGPTSLNLTAFRFVSKEDREAKSAEAVEQLRREVEKEAA